MRLHKLCMEKRRLPWMFHNCIRVMPSLGARLDKISLECLPCLQVLVFLIVFGYYCCCLVWNYHYLTILIICLKKRIKGWFHILISLCVPISLPTLSLPCCPNILLQVPNQVSYFTGHFHCNILIIVQVEKLFFLSSYCPSR